MAYARSGRNLRSYRRAADRLKRTSTICWICGVEIDVDLPYTDGDSFTADHVDALALGGDIHGELRPAHRRCNSARGTGERKAVPELRTSREW
jgi:hypothetical protein